MREDDHLAVPCGVHPVVLLNGEAAQMLHLLVGLHARHFHPSTHFTPEGSRRREEEAMHNDHQHGYERERQG